MVYLPYPSCGKNLEQGPVLIKFESRVKQEGVVFLGMGIQGLVATFFQ